MTLKRHELQALSKTKRNNREIDNNIWMINGAAVLITLHTLVEV
jgi:hypothetical protein